MSDVRLPRTGVPPFRISVVIPAFNAAPYVPAALASVARQRGDPAFSLEIVVVDDGSTDETAAIVERTAPDVRCLRQPHLGCAAARNFGVRASKGDLIAFLDADDLWRDGKLAAQLQHLLAYRNLDMVFARAEEFLSEDLTEDERREIVLRGVPLPARVAGTMLIWRDAFLRAGFFDPQWRLGEFVQWALRARDAGLQDAMLPEVMLSRRLHRTNMGRRQSDARKDYLDIITQHLARRRAMQSAGTS